MNGGDRLLEISEAAWTTLRDHVQREPSAHEAGGILLGRIVVNTGHFIVDRATPPNAQDRRSRFRFWRSQPTSQRLVDRAWHDSGGACIYLGEWHTHPEDDPEPSAIDRIDRAQLLAGTKCEQDRLIFVIVGRTRVHFWEGDRATLAVREVAAVPVDG